MPTWAYPRSHDTWLADMPNTHIAFYAYCYYIVWRRWEWNDGALTLDRGPMNQAAQRMMMMLGEDALPLGNELAALEKEDCLRLLGERYPLWPADVIESIADDMCKKPLPSADQPISENARNVLAMLGVGIEGTRRPVPMDIHTSVRGEESTWDQKNDYWKKRRMFMAATWLLGASWGMLAVAFEMQKSSARNAAWKELRNLPQVRLRERCTYAQLEAYMASYKEGYPFLKGRNAKDVAIWLHSNTDDVGDE